MSLLVTGNWTLTFKLLEVFTRHIRTPILTLCRYILLANPSISQCHHDRKKREQAKLLTESEKLINTTISLTYQVRC